jgi:hypothetical protein
MGKLLVDLDREALERVRVKLGARSHAEALRKLIEAADVAPTVSREWGGMRVLPAGSVETVLLSADTSRAKVTNPGRPKIPYGSRLKKR